VTGITAGGLGRTHQLRFNSALPYQTRKNPGHRR
jgi:hypothetical protein